MFLAGSFEFPASEHGVRSKTQRKVHNIFMLSLLNAWAIDGIPILQAAMTNKSGCFIDCSDLI
jgi:hypothetical protein